jgi:hypothetical protein
MRVGFVETMRGTLRDGAAEHPVEFSIRTEAPGWRAFLRDGVTRACGVMRAAPWAREAACEGTLTLSVRRPRIAYSLTFTADDGRVLTLAGEKRPTPRSPLGSMTTLPMALTDAAGTRLAEGTLFFDLRDLAPFALSWLPVAGDRGARALDTARIALHRRALER